MVLNPMLPKEHTPSSPLNKDPIPSPTQLAFQVGDHIFAIHESSEGYDYSFYHSDYSEMDGGIFDDPEASIYEAMAIIGADNYLVAGHLLAHPESLPALDFDEVCERAEAMMQAKIEATLTERNKPLPIDVDRINIEVEGHFGTWQVIDTMTINGTDYFLLEHEEVGDDAACVIVGRDGKLILDDAWNGFDDLTYHLDSQEQKPLAPDPTLTSEDANDYGYNWEGMYPLSQEAAKDLWSRGLCLYRLYPDNTEGMVESLAELDTHDGLFGVEVADWQRHQELTPSKPTKEIEPTR